MLIQYETKRFQPKTLEMIEKANEIIDEYQDKGYNLTLRQLYYQFVARDWIENNNRSYKNLGKAVSNGRLAGLISWEAIVDRTRRFISNSHWSDPGSVLESARDSYAIDMWENQPNHVEVWIEKEALVDVIAGPCGELDVMYFACKGNTSQSSSWRAAMRAGRKVRKGKEVTIIHLGDHDPSGVDMTRDIQARFDTFRVPVTVDRIALTMDQVEELDPPPSPAKTTDPRGTGYIEEYGDESWELDALPPDYIDALVRDKILGLRDEDLFEERLQTLTKHKEILDHAIDSANVMIEEEEDEDDEE